ncbi:MAG: hypothetical protein GY830_04665 [Bacteroidetes bacterium]|nr:hypothetical protein [Bacteroidota bacterium]
MISDYIEIDEAELKNILIKDIENKISSFNNTKFIPSYRTKKIKLNKVGGITDKNDFCIFDENGFVLTNPKKIINLNCLFQKSDFKNILIHQQNADYIIRYVNKKAVPYISTYIITNFLLIAIFVLIMSLLFKKEYFEMTFAILFFILIGILFIKILKLEKLKNDTLLSIKIYNKINPDNTINLYELYHKIY